VQCESPFNCVLQILLLIYLLTSLYETHQTAKKLDMGCAAVCDKSVITGVHKTDEEKVYFLTSAFLVSSIT